MLRSLFLFALALSPLTAYSASEGQVLHAVFASFQEPGIFTEEYIESQRQVVLNAAKEGDTIASMVDEHIKAASFSEPEGSRKAEIAQFE